MSEHSFMKQFQNLYTKGFQAWKAQIICEIHLLATIFDEMTQCNMGCHARNPVFGVSEKVRLKLVPSATETS